MIVVTRCEGARFGPFSILLMGISDITKRVLRISGWGRIDGRLVDYVNLRHTAEYRGVIDGLKSLRDDLNSELGWVSLLRHCSASCWHDWCKAS